ncbi:germin-like protein subfamily 2 member 4 [Prosopis cineraria]|uniref:germin-like protein subfamily 2 member 4 n=1 Tax=Prosopis cineraria TaxID=364024 RepID=UPI002410A047|nr:germin-like protein subfamily 2 member 4 [Prosopis cineraria]
MSPTTTFAILVIVSNVISLALASDPDTLQDLCVALPSSSVKVNGYACKDEANVTAADFFFDGLAKQSVILDNNTAGLAVKLATVDQIPGLNTLGLSLARADYRDGGFTPPHTHPRATEIVFVLEGELQAGFIITSTKHFTKTLKKGEVFVFPKGSLHYLKNIGKTPASHIVAFNSQNPGALFIEPALFSATPSVPDDVLAKTFQISVEEVEQIKNPKA